MVVEGLQTSMTTVRARGEAVRKFILANLEEHAQDIVRVTAERFSCSRQAVHKHLQRLIDEGSVLREGNTRRRTYRLAPLARVEKAYTIQPGLTEDEVWRVDISPVLGRLPDNVMGIWQYGFTEMLNNAIEHSGGSVVTLRIEKTAASSTIEIFDDGVGIFKKIQAALNLADERHAVLELAKGKFTTDPAHHSGEGIFFSSRMFDEFVILSGGVFFSHEFEETEDWIIQPGGTTGGTLVRMVLHNHTARSTNNVFSKFVSDDDFAFSKTVVPVKLMRYGDDNLISRSQAKRLLSRFDRFRVVILDFSAVSTIGQAFADEVFRVFRKKHPDVELIPIKANSEVKRMISRAEALAAAADA